MATSSPRGAQIALSMVSRTTSPHEPQMRFSCRPSAFGVLPAATLSAAAFAVAHGYGVLGFVAVFWSGALWALSYEKTGSLWPGIIAHSVGNLMATAGVLALLRL